MCSYPCCFHKAMSQCDILSFHCNLVLIHLRFCIFYFLMNQSVFGLSKIEPSHFLKFYVKHWIRNAPEKTAAKPTIPTLRKFLASHHIEFSQRFSTLSAVYLRCILGQCHPSKLGISNSVIWAHFMVNKTVYSHKYCLQTKGVQGQCALGVALVGNIPHIDCCCCR